MPRQAFKAERFHSLSPPPPHPVPLSQLFFILKLPDRGQMDLSKAFDDVHLYEGECMSWVQSLKGREVKQKKAKHPSLEGGH